jgi:hypothetical protein
MGQVSSCFVREHKSHYPLMLYPSVYHSIIQPFLTHSFSLFIDYTTNRSPNDIIVDILDNDDIAPTLQFTFRK